MVGTILCLIIFCSFNLLIFGWDLSIYNISSSYYVSSVAVFGVHVFLALPRSSCFNDVSNPTMVDAFWYNEQQLIFRKSSFFVESQLWNNCEHLQDVISLDMEPLRSRLWVLDRGNTKCSQKIVIYQLFDKANYTLDAPENIGEKFNNLLVDDEDSIRAYVGLDEASYLLVFSLNEFKWWKINLESNSLLPISTKFLCFALKIPIMFITGGNETAIFSMDLTLLRNLELEEDETFFNVTFLGEKLGASSGLVADYKDGLTYYMTHDFAVVRWNTRKPPQAEYYNVLAQSYEVLPYVSQLYRGPQNGIWAIANPGPPDECPDDSPMLTKRLIKLLKYNINI